MLKLAVKDEVDRTLLHVVLGQPFRNPEYIALKCCDFWQYCNDR